MEEQYPLFTVIIPQQNRIEYLRYTLKTCMIQDYPNLEFIIADDCSSDGTVEMIRDLQKSDPRIKLIAHECHVGMRENFESALATVQPGYVIALGGDDGLVPGCFWRMYDIIKETGTQLLTWQLPTFFYPDRTGVCRMSVRRGKQKGYRLIKSEDFLNKIAQTLNYLVDDCPMFYIKGVASTDLVNRVKGRTPDGCFYYCPTPDGFSGVVLAGEVEEYVYTDEPLSINGATVKSQGYSYMQSDKKSKEASAQFFNDSSRKMMHEALASQPYSPLFTLMTADYLLTARDLPGWPGKYKEFGFDHLLRRSFDFIAHTDYTNDTLVRELLILREIAIQHNHLPLFESLMKSTKKRVRKKTQLDGLLITKNVFSFNATKLGITNIYEAALSMTFAYNLCNQASLNEFNCFIKTMIKEVFAKFVGNKEPLPSIR